jgi:glycosyltransferase involved in cell wall biosynthesis
MISIYSFVKNGVFYDFHLVEMLKHHLPLADEIVINEGYSSDSTYEAISNISPKIKVFRTEWGRAKGIDWFPKFKNEARKRCVGDWCILLDCDEFIPEWEFEGLRAFLSQTDKDLVPMNFLNFYGNYKVYHPEPRKVGWAATNVRIHRNLPDIEVWGDGANVKSNDPGKTRACAQETFNCHHFGFVRNPARLRQKWSMQGQLYRGKRSWIPRVSFLFDLAPHDWNDPQFLGDLAPYEGPYVKAVMDNPSEFVRDDFRVYQLLKSRP